MQKLLKITVITLIMQNYSNYAFSNPQDNLYEAIFNAWKSSKPKSPELARKGYNVVLRARIIVSASRLFCHQSFDEDTEFQLDYTITRWEGWADIDSKEKRLLVLNGLNKHFPESEADCDAL